MKRTYKSRVTILLADKKINRLMKAADLCPEYKVFVGATETVEVEMNRPHDMNLLHNIVEKSRESNDAKFWIPVATCGDLLYVASGIREISDGKHTMFVPQMTEAE